MAIGDHASDGTCPQCGGSKPPHRMFCRPECQWDSMRTRPSISCKGCGISFPKRARGKDANLFCGHACAVLHKSSRKWRTRAEARRAGRVAASARRRQRLGLDIPATCARCGASFLREHRQHRYCSDACRVARPLATRLCLRCGLEFTPSHGAQRLCSEVCRKEYRKRHRPKGGRKDRHRARRAGVEYQWINRTKLYERDGWRCQVCGVKTPKRLRGKLVDRAPELDHRIPLAQGGTHTWENVQLACRKCNAEKGADRVVGQMPLFARPAQIKTTQARD